MYLHLLYVISKTLCNRFSDLLLFGTTFIAGKLKCIWAEKVQIIGSAGNTGLAQMSNEV